LRHISVIVFNISVSVKLWIILTKRHRY